MSSPQSSDSQASVIKAYNIIGVPPGYPMSAIRKVVDARIAGLGKTSEDLETKNMIKESFELLCSFKENELKEIARDMRKEAQEPSPKNATSPYSQASVSFRSGQENINTITPNDMPLAKPNRIKVKSDEESSAKNVKYKNSEKESQEKIEESNRSDSPKFKFNPPPGWPIPPKGWLPPEGWTPQPEWPEPPPDWDFFVDERPGNGYGPPRSDIKNNEKPKTTQNKNIGKLLTNDEKNPTIINKKIKLFDRPIAKDPLLWIGLVIASIVTIININSISSESGSLGGATSGLVDAIFYLGTNLFFFLLIPLLVRYSYRKSKNRNGNG